jgi:hypothetical protein
MKKYFSGELPTHPVLVAKRNKMLDLIPKKKVEQVYVAPPPRRKRAPANILGLPLEIFKLLYRSGAEEEKPKKASEFTQGLLSRKRRFK